MTVVNVALDVLARFTDDGLPVRALFLVTDFENPPAEAVLVREAIGENGIIEHRRDSVVGITAHTPRMWTVNLTAGGSYTLEPSTGTCGSCGGGRLKVYDPLPGFERQMVRVPRWLKSDL